MANFFSQFEEAPASGTGVELPPSRPGMRVSPEDQRQRDRARLAILEEEYRQNPSDPALTKELTLERSKQGATAAPSAPGKNFFSQFDETAPAPKALPKATQKQATPDRVEQAISAFTPAGMAKSAAGVAETGAQMLTSIPGMAIGGLAGIAGALLPGEQGQGAKWSENVSRALTYQPQTEAGKNISATVAYPFEKANEGLGYVGEKVGGEAGRTIGENAIPVVTTVLPGLPKARGRLAQKIDTVLKNPETVRNQNMFPVRDEQTGQITYYSPKEVQFARENAPLLEAHEAARNLGVKTNPARTNPTPENLTMASRATERHLDAALAAENEQVWGNALRRDIGLEKNAPITPDTIGQLRQNAAVPAQAIAEQGGMMMPTPDHISAIQRLRRESTIASPEISGQSAALVDRAMRAVETGADASQLLREIADLRADANKLYQATGGGPEMAAKARAYKQLANTLEDMVQTNLERLARSDPYGQYAEMARAYPEARATMAKSYVLEDVTDFNTGKIDPTKLAKMTADDSALTGAFQDVGKVTGNFPESAIATAPEPGFFETRMSRSSKPAVAGAVLGSLFSGIPGVNPITGSSAALYGAEVLGRRATKKALTPEAQMGGINPVPRELWDMSNVDPLTSRYNFERPPIFREFNAPPPPGPLGLPAPPAAPGPRGPVENAPDMYRHPNFQFGENNPPQPPAPGTSVVPGRPLTPEEQWRQAKGNFAAQDRARYERESAMDALAQQRAESEAAALRRPATGERVLDLNPMTGRLEPASRGLPGATPDTIQSTGSSLESATQKLSEGRAFAMTPEEKIAWKHTQTSLVEGVPELRGLSERQIFDRMRDREWIAETIKKLREKDIAFEGIRRSAEEQAARLKAAKERELLADQLEMLEEQFRKPQNRQSGGQGPKTRAFQQAQIDALRNKE